MARSPVSDLSAWPSLSLEGNLIAPAMIARIDQRDAPQQTPEDYTIRKGLTIREEISTAFRVGQSHFDAFARIENPSPEAARRFMRDFLAETFGFDDIAPGTFPATFIAGARVPVVVVPPGEERLDARSPTLSQDANLSPAFALQHWFNNHDTALWGLVTNGTRLRLSRHNASLTRPAHIEADLAQIFTTEDAASFATLWLLIHRSRFGATDAPATDCALEHWRNTGAREGEAARDRLAGQVEQALRILGSGFLEPNPDLAARLTSGEINLTDWFNELLRLVYRLIFLMVAEDRDLLHFPDTPAATRSLYAEGYSLAHLREQSYRRASWDRYHDRWEGLRIVFRALADGESRLGLPALGGLFAANQLPHLEAARLRNRALMEAIYRLSWLEQPAGMVPVNWRAMETEELGSVYESLLELQPQLGDDGKTLVFASDAAEQRGNQRKTTGSYYTPDSLVEALLDTALDPVLDRTEGEADDPARALLNLTVIDPACGSGHFLLAAARRIATRLARIRAEGTPSSADFRQALRDVARHCIHGVDRNPMAVELTKVALWIETVDPGQPLGFFDAQIRCGDALLGVFDLGALQDGIPDAAYKALSGDDRPVANHYRQKNRRERKERDHIAEGFGFGRQKDLMRDFARLRAMPENTVEDIAAKARVWQKLTRKGAAAWQLEAACDLYTAAFLLPKRAGGQFAGPDGLPRRGEEMVPTSGTLWEYLRGREPFGPLFGAALDAARKARAFHWPLEFPVAMGRGGFDVVLGNPPWEVMQLDEREYFTTRKPEIAALSGAARKRAIAALELDEPAIFAQFTSDKRHFDAVNEFARASGRFDLTARGKVNTYALFAELFANLARSRAGVIVPTGIATDATTAPFFAHLVETRRLARLVDFENRARLFPDVDSRMKFVLLTLGRDESEAQFAFFLTDPAQLAEAERNFTLSPETIARLNPNTRTAPVFRSRADAELTAKIYANAPVLIDEAGGEEGNPWKVEFRQGLFNMTSDSHLFRTAAQLAEAGYRRQCSDWLKPPAAAEARDDGPNPARYVPLYEAKMIHQFDHRWAGYDDAGQTTSDLTTEAKTNPETEPQPRYWVPEAEVTARLDAKGWNRGWLMGWRDITNATNERTVIATVFPRVGAGDTLLIKMPNVHDFRLYGANVANLCSLPLDYATRQKIGGTHLKYNIFKQLPILPPTSYTSPRLAFITSRVLEFIYTSHELAPFARDLGYDGSPFPWDEDRRAQLRAELDAFFARAYGLTRDELRYILDPADVMGPDYPSETFRVLKDKEIRQHGEYRTQRLVLAAWDRLEAEGVFAGMGV